VSRAQRRREARAKKKSKKTRGQKVVWCPFCGAGFETVQACVDHQDEKGHVIEAH